MSQATQEPFPAYTGSREEWANQVLAHLVPDLAALGIVMPVGRHVRIAVTPLGRGTLGRCRASAASVTGQVNFIDLCTKQAEPFELVHTLIHEYLHACDDCASGHRNRWRRWAELLGMERRGHARNGKCQSLIRGALAAVGVPVQHELSRDGAASRAQTSQVRMSCPRCLKHAYIPRGAFEDGFGIGCLGCACGMVESGGAGR